MLVFSGEGSHDMMGYCTCKKPPCVGRFSTRFQHLNVGAVNAKESWSGGAWEPHQKWVNVVDAFSCLKGEFSPIPLPAGSFQGKYP